MSARSPLICSAVELWYKKMLKIGSLSELTGIDTKIKVAGFQRLYSKWLWLLMAVYKPSFADAYYSSEQIVVTYQMTKKTICRLCRENDIPKISHGGFNYYEQLAVNRFFAKYKAADNIKEWIGAEQMEAIYGMSKDARCSFVHRHKIPSRVVYGKVQYSKDHIDIIKNGGFDQREKYYSVAEAMEKYGLRRDDVYNYARYNNIRKMHHGKSMFLLKEDFDKVMAEKSVT